MTKVTMEILEENEWKPFLIYFTDLTSGTVEPDERTWEVFKGFNTRRITLENKLQKYKTILTFKNGDISGEFQNG